MTTPIIEGINLEQLWNQEPPACNIYWGKSDVACGKEAKWAWKIDCPCGVKVTFLVCQECKDKITALNIKYHTNPACNIGVELKQRWTML